MKKRFVIGLVLIGLFALAVTVILWLQPPRASYRGKSVKTWAKLAYNGNAEAAAALKTLGTNAIPELIELLQTQDTYLHKGAWEFKKKLKPRLRQIFFKKLEPPLASADRGAAARALGIIGPEAREAVPALSQALRDRNNQTCYDAATAMGQIGAASVPYLVDALKDPDPNRRRALVGALGQVGPGGEAAVPTLIELLNDPDEMVRQRADYALKNLGAPWMSRLVEVIAKGPSGSRDIAARELLVLYRAPFQASKALIEMAHDPVAGTRRQAIETLRVLRPLHQAAIGAFTEALKDPDREVRLAAATALGEIGERAMPAVTALTERMTEDQDPAVRGAAREALRKIQPGASVSEGK